MASRSGRSSRSSLMHTKRSFMYAAVSSSSNDSRSITWHQWQGGGGAKGQDRPVLLACAREGLLAPRMPVHGVVLVLQQVGRGLLREPFGHRGRGYPDPALRCLSNARLIFPLAVFGSDSANSTMRGYLYGAVSDLTWSCSSRASSSLGSAPARSTTTARTTAPRSGSGAATAAASATAGCETSADSTSNGPIR